MAYQHFSDFSEVTHVINDLNDAVVKLADYVEQLSTSIHDLEVTMSDAKKKINHLFNYKQDITPTKKPGVYG